MALTVDDLLNSSNAVYGFGRAGRSLCASLASVFLGKVIAYCRKPSDSQIEYAKKHRVELFSDERLFFHRVREASAKTLFVAVSDDAISLVAQKNAKEEFVPPFVAHLAGALSCEVLLPLSTKSRIAQFHPMASLDGENVIPKCSVAIGANDFKAREHFSKIGVAFFCDTFSLKHDDVEIYHAAAAITSNLSLGLVNISRQILIECGMDPLQAQRALAALLQSNVQNLYSREFNECLTGPVIRGDVNTVRKHLMALSKHDLRDVIPIYKALSHELVYLVNLSGRTHRELSELLNE